MHQPEFLEAIAAEPDEDLPRLVYADWLDEQGDPRGEFIRVQCELDTLEMSNDPRFWQLRNRERKLKGMYGIKWSIDDEQYLQHISSINIDRLRDVMRRGFFEYLNVQNERLVEGALKQTMDAYPAHGITADTVVLNNPFFLCEIDQVIKERLNALFVYQNYEFRRHDDFNQRAHRTLHTLLEQVLPKLRSLKMIGDVANSLTPNLLEQHRLQTIAVNNYEGFALETVLSTIAKTRAKHIELRGSITRWEEVMGQQLPSSVSTLEISRNVMELRNIVDMLSAAVSNGKNIQDIRMNGLFDFVPQDTEDLQHLGALIRHCRLLEIADLELGRDYLENIIAGAEGSFPNLSVLDVSGNNLSYNELRDMLESNVFPNLMEINAGFDPIINHYLRKWRDQKPHRFVHGLW